MTYSEFKDELARVKENRFIIKSRLESLEKLSEEKLSMLGPGVVDYSKDRLQMSHDPDKLIIETIDRINREAERLKESIRELEEENRYMEDLILSKKGLSGEVLRLYYIEGLMMKNVAKRLGFTEDNGWKLYRKGVRNLYEQEEAKKV